jgi:hypothetical protein
MWAPGKYTSRGIAIGCAVQLPLTPFKDGDLHAGVIVVDVDGVVLGVDFGDVTLFETTPCPHWVGAIAAAREHLAPALAKAAA